VPDERLRDVCMYMMETFGVFAALDWFARGSARNGSL
jgi:hypothetical protein